MAPYRTVYPNNGFNPQPFTYNMTIRNIHINSGQFDESFPKSTVSRYFTKLLLRGQGEQSTEKTFKELAIHHGESVDYGMLPSKQVDNISNKWIDSQSYRRSKEKGNHYLYSTSLFNHRHRKNKIASNRQRLRTIFTESPFPEYCEL